MKYLLSGVFSLVIGVILSQSIFAQSNAELRQILETNSCESCNMPEATLRNLDLKGINLKGANLSGADFSGSDLTGADLTDTYLYGAKLVHTNLESAKLLGARISGVDLTDANLRDAEMDLTPNWWDQSSHRETGILFRIEGNYPEITSFDLNGNSKYLTSKSGKLYRSMKEESTKFGNYIRRYSDLLAAYKKSSGITIDEWGKRHWEAWGQYNENRHLYTLPNFEVVLDLNDDPKFRSDQEVGLLSVVSIDNLIYLSYTIQEGSDNRENVYLVVDEYSETLEKIRTIIRIRVGSFTHVAGTLVTDQFGKLYLSVGEGGLSEYAPQSMDSLLGKILRIDVSEADPEPEVIAYGLRNPWKYSIDLENRMFIGDCGEVKVESVYLLRDLYPSTPYNLGWPVFEGTERRQERSLQFEDTLPPIYEYRHHDKGACAIGGFFIDELNVYLFGDYLGKVRLLEEKNQQWQEIHIQETRGVLSFGMDKNTGETYVSGWANIYRVMPLKEEMTKYPLVVLCRTTMPDGKQNNSDC
jgi:hypothetical protein